MKIIGENTAKINGGSSLTKRYIDIVEPEEEIEPQETAEEIIKEISDMLEEMGKEGE